MSRAVRVVVGIVVGAAACGDNHPSPPPPPVVIEAASFSATPNRALDLLLLIDDSNSTFDYQINLGAAMPALLAELTGVDGALPDLHIGVATSDMGASGSLDFDHPAPSIGTLGQGGCASYGKDGVLQTTGAPVTGSFVIDVDDGQGGRTRNYQGALADVLTTMSEVGSGGCGFEQQLAASRRALTDQVNPGFVRPDANLAVFVIADEDDCSVRDTGLFNPGNDDLGNLDSFRCTLAGVECDQDLTVVGAKTNCHSNPTSQYVDDVDQYGTFYAQLKGTRDRVVLGVIAGDPTPFAVELRPGPNGGTPIPALAHSCEYTGNDGLGNVADPGARFATLVGELESHGTMTSVCSRDLTAQLKELGRVTKQLLGVACLDTSKLADELLDLGVQPGCTVSDVHGSDPPVAIPACPSSGDCYELVADSLACPETSDHLLVKITRVTTPAADTFVHVDCRAR